MKHFLDTNITSKMIMLTDSFVQNQNVEENFLKINGHKHLIMKKIAIKETTGGATIVVENLNFQVENAQ